MKNTDRDAALLFPVLVAAAFAAGWAGSQGGGAVGGVPLFGLCAGLALAMQWLAFFPASRLQTEKFYDLTGSITFVTVTTLALALSPGIDARAVLLWAVVVIWTARLGTFLFRRVLRAGRDDRFDEIKPSFFRFLNAWTLQGLWVIVTSSAALAGITTGVRKELDGFALVGLALWAAGFGIEVVADRQKSRFNADPANRGRFIQSGLWSRSRHPNYFGEILLWTGVMLIALPVLQGWQLLAMASPLFVTLLLTRASGIPLLEQKADRKWGGQPEYEAYKRRTPVLIPRLGDLNQGK